MADLIQDQAEEAVGDQTQAALAEAVEAEALEEEGTADHFLVDIILLRRGLFLHVGEGCSFVTLKQMYYEL